MGYSIVSSEKLKLELSYDPTIPLLGICPKQIKPGCQRNMSIPVLLAVFIIVKNRNSVYFINWCIDKEIGHTHIMK